MNFKIEKLERDYRATREIVGVCETAVNIAQRRFDLCGDEVSLRSLQETRRKLEDAREFNERAKRLLYASGGSEYASLKRDLDVSIVNDRVRPLVHEEARLLLALAEIRAKKQQLADDVAAKERRLMEIENEFGVVDRCPRRQAETVLKPGPVNDALTVAFRTKYAGTTGTVETQTVYEHVRALKVSFRVPEARRYIRTERPHWYNCLSCRDC